MHTVERDSRNRCHIPLKLTRIIFSLEEDSMWSGTFVEVIILWALWPVNGIIFFTKENGSSYMNLYHQRSKKKKKGRNHLWSALTLFSIEFLAFRNAKYKVYCHNPQMLAFFYKKKVNRQRRENNMSLYSVQWGLLERELPVHDKPSKVKPMIFRTQIMHTFGKFVLALYQ